MRNASSTSPISTNRAPHDEHLRYEPSVNALAAAIKSYHAKLLHCIHLLDRARILPMPALDLESYRGLVDAVGGVLLVALHEISTIDSKVAVLEEQYAELLSTIVWGIAEENAEHAIKTPTAKNHNGACC